MANMPDARCMPEYLTAEEAAYMRAHTQCYDEPEFDFLLTELMEEELCLTTAELNDLLQHNMNEIRELGERIEDHPHFLKYLVESGIYKPDDGEQIGKDVNKQGEETGEQTGNLTNKRKHDRNDPRIKASILMARMRNEIKNKRKRNSSVELDEEEIERMKDMLEKLHEARFVLG